MMSGGEKKYLMTLDFGNKNTWLIMNAKYI